MHTSVNKPEKNLLSHPSFSKLECHFSCYFESPLHYIEFLRDAHFIHSNKIINNQFQKIKVSSYFDAITSTFVNKNHTEDADFENQIGEIVTRSSDDVKVKL